MLLEYIHLWNRAKEERASLPPPPIFPSLPSPPQAPAAAVVAGVDGKSIGCGVAAVCGGPGGTHLCSSLLLALLLAFSENAHTQVDVGGGG